MCTLPQTPRILYYAPPQVGLGNWRCQTENVTHTEQCNSWNGVLVPLLVVVSNARPEGPTLPHILSNYETATLHEISSSVPHGLREHRVAVESMDLLKSAGAWWPGSQIKDCRAKAMEWPGIRQGSAKKWHPPTSTLPDWLQTDFLIVCACVCVCVCLYMCVRNHWVPGRVACGLKIAPVKIRILYPLL